MDHSNIPYNSNSNNNNSNAAVATKKKLSDTFSSRTKLEFKSSASSADVEYNEQQEANLGLLGSSIESSSNQHSSSKWASLDSRESEVAEEEDTRPLYERLMENKLKKQQELEQVIGNQAPKSLDEDDILYLKEQEEKLKRERLEIINKEKEEIQKYLQESHIVKDLNSSSIDESLNLDKQQDKKEKEDLISQLEIVEVKKRKRKDESEKKKKKKTNLLVASTSLDYDSS